MNFRTALILLCLYCAGGHAETALLPDQYGQTGGLSNYPNQPLLVIVVTGKKLRWIGRWEKQLRAQLPELVSVRVADINDQPPPSLEQVSSRLRKHVPENVSILIDMNSSWANKYKLDTNEPCLLILDDKHQLTAQFRGRPNSDLVAQVIAGLRVYYPDSAPSVDATP